MTNTKHTPGPWSAHYNNEGLTVFSPDNVPVAYVDYDECEERPVEANAHLIAAAPAMYEALQWTMQYLRMPNFHPDNSYNSEQWARDYNKLTDALAQADGEGILP